MADEEGPAWLPDSGAVLTRSDLTGIFVALRAIIAGTEPDEPNRAHAVSIAYLISEAIDRMGDVE